MILSYKNTKTRKVHETGKPKGFKGLDGNLAAIRLDELDAAKSVNDLSPLKSVNLHKLSRDRKDQWAVHVNGPWRLCFTPNVDGFDDVEIIDCH